MMSRKLHRNLLVAGLIAAGSGVSVPALAQSSGAVATLEEVFVTARRRQESLQDVPIAITALSEEYIRVNKIDKLDDIQFHSPGLTIGGTSATGNVPIIALRGQRPTEALIHLEPAVPMYFADVAMAPSNGSNLSLYDLSNVQVLKGPQGTLFGRNSTGGALLFTPTAPGDELGGFFQAGVGDYDLFETEFGVDLPASDSVRFRVAGKTVKRDGYQENVAADVYSTSLIPSPNPDYGKDYWDEDSKGLRISMVADITDSLENYLVVSWDENDTAGRVQVMRSVNPQHQLGGIIALTGSPERQIAYDDPTKVEGGVPGSYDDVETWFAANTTTWETGDITFKNVLGYRDIEHSVLHDPDGANIPIIVSMNDTDAEMFSEEFQVQGLAFSEKLEWIAGVYYYWLEGSQREPSTFFDGALTLGANADIENTSYAIFAQGTYALTDKWSLTFGARNSWDEREITLRHTSGSGAATSCTVLDENGNLLPPDNCRRTLDDDWSQETWLASASYAFSDTTMAYGSVSTGYRTGGFNIRGKKDSELAPFDQEDVINYELGLKSDWTLGNMPVRTNFAIYYQDYQDIQRTTAIPDPDGPSLIVFVSNAAEATIQGFEAELQLVPVEGLTISANYAYVDTEYDEFFDETDGVPRDGAEFEWIPDDSVTATIRYVLPLDPAIGEISLQANYYYQSDMLADQPDPQVPDELEEPVLVADSYSIQNYGIDWFSVMGSRFDLSLYIKNATDKDYITGGQTVLDTLGVANYNYGPPRTYGASVRYTF